EFDDAQLSGATGPATVTRSLKDREETQEMQAFTLGGEHFIDAWTVEYAAGFSKSSEDESGGISGAGFTGYFPAGMGFNGTRKPRLIAPADFYDPANYKLDEVEYTEGLTEDEQTSVNLDITRDFFAGNYPALVKFGGKLTRREKEQDINEYKFKKFEDNGF